MIIKKHLTPWVVWALPVIFCVFQFVLRLFPGRAQNQLMADFGVGAGAFGGFSAAYYLGYALFQIPIAILLEKYKARIIISISALLCALGCFTLSSTQSWNLAILSRFMIGVGSVTGLLGTTKIVLDWFPVRNHAKMIGISMSIGLMGAVYGGKPVSLMIDKSDWRNVLFQLGIIVSLIALIAFFTVRNKNSDRDNILKLEKFSWTEQIISLLKNKMFIVLGIANFLMAGCLEGFADIWGINYLSIATNISVAEASLFTSLIFVGMIIGMPILSFMADRTNSHINITSFCGILMALSLSFLLLNPQMFSVFRLKFLMVFIGILSGYQALILVIGERLVPKILSNTAIAALNCINMFGGAFFHETIGIFVDLAAKQEIGSGTHSIDKYSLSEYSVGLAVIPVLSLVGGILLFLCRRLQNKL